MKKNGANVVRQVALKSCSFWVVLIGLAHMLVPTGVWAQDPITGTEIRITNDPGDQFDPAVSRGKIAYTDNDSGSGNADIWVYDIASGGYTQVTNGPDSEKLGDIDGSYVVYTDSVPLGPDPGSYDLGWQTDIYSYDLSTNTRRLVVGAEGDQENPAISGNLVVWEDFRSGSGRIWTGDVLGSGARMVYDPPDGQPQITPAISGTLVTWQGGAGGSEDIFAYDLATNTLYNVAVGADRARDPDVSGNTVVYTSSVGLSADSNIYAFNVASGVRLQLSTDPTGQLHPKISGTKVVWEDYRNGNADLYGYDLSLGGVDFPVVVDPNSRQSLHDVDGLDVAYTDDKGRFDGSGTGLDVYLLLAAPQLTAITVTPENPTISVGQTQPFTATGAFDDGSTQVLSNGMTPPSGLVSWWPGDGNASDIIDGNPGTLQGGATFAPGKVGEGFALDGIDDFVEIPDAPNLKPVFVTVDAWVTFDALDTPGAAVPGLQYLVFKKNTRTYNYEGYALLKLRIGGVDRFQFIVTSAEGVQFSGYSTTAVVTDQSYHVAGTYDGSAVRLYVNGILEGESLAKVALDYSNRPLFIGTSGESYFDGKLQGIVDEAEIYNRALSASEIQTIFAAGSAGKCHPGARCVTWSSSDTAVATMGETGLAAGLSPGATTITATSGGISGSTTLTVASPDTTPPVISFDGTCPATVVLGAVATVTVTVTDDLSGVAVQSVPNGPSTLDTSTVGAKTFTVSASDNAGNETSNTCTYQVTYDFEGAGGFGPPIEGPPAVNTARAGGTLPVKWQVPDGSGGYISDLGVVEAILFQEVPCDDYSNGVENPVPTETSGNSGLHYDAATNQYIYNWKTERAMAGKCYVLILRLNDGSEYRVNFMFS